MSGKKVLRSKVLNRSEDGVTEGAPVTCIEYRTESKLLHSVITTAVNLDPTSFWDLFVVLLEHVYSRG